MEKTHHLRVLIANQRADRLDLLAHVVGGLGHDVSAREIDVTEVGGVTARVRPDVALVGFEKPDESRDTVLGALENARAIVGRSLDELQSEGMSVEQLIQNAARTGR